MRYAIVVILVSSVIIAGLRFWSGTGQAAALNETDLPQEADFCLIQFPPLATIDGGDSLQVFGRIFEAGVTDGPGAHPFISAQVGFGPQGSDPRVNEVDWSWSGAIFNADVASEDEYLGDITPPSGASTIDYAYAYRFSTDFSADYTYCDLDGAGSNAGANFDVDELGLLTVTGTSGGGGEGSVDTSVDVIADPGACILLDTNAVTYGQETFSTQNAAQSGVAQVTISSCSLTTSLDLLAKGTNASGPTANWALTDPPGSGNMCDTSGDGVDKYGQRVQAGGMGVQGADLALTNRTYMTGLPQGASQPTALILRMPCIGSSGTGETVTSTITFTAIPSAVGVDNDGDGYTSLGGDCDDSDPSVNPGATEVLNGIDDNCDGSADEGVLPVDADADGFTNDVDCDDSNAAVNPGATEVLNGIDDDCDGSADEDTFNPCSVMPIGLSEGTIMVDNNFCTTAPGAEPVASCAGPGARHNQYFGFTLAAGQSATVTVTASWNAVLAVYDDGLNELDCSDASSGGGSEVVAVNNVSPGPVNYIVQVDGFGPGDFGVYTIALNIN